MSLYSGPRSTPQLVCMYEHVLTALRSCTRVQVSAQLPQWALGSSAKLSLKRPQPSSVQPEAPPPAPAAKTAAWKLAADDGEDEELVDDEQLLTAEDKAAAAKPGARGDPGAASLLLLGRGMCRDNCS